MSFLKIFITLFSLFAFVKIFLFNMNFRFAFFFCFYHKSRVFTYPIMDFVFTFYSFMELEIFIFNMMSKENLSTNLKIPFLEAFRLIYIYILMQIYQVSWNLFLQSVYNTRLRCLKHTVSYNQIQGNPFKQTFKFLLNSQ